MQKSYTLRPVVKKVEIAKFSFLLQLSHG